MSDYSGCDRLKKIWRSKIGIADSTTDQAISDLVLLHSFFKQLLSPKPDFENVDRSSQLTKSVVPYDQAETNVKNVEIADEPIIDEITDEILLDSERSFYHVI